MLDRARHELILNNIIKDVSGDRFLAPILGLKGGTACYLLYGMPRFSTDLDFNLLNSKQKEKVFKRFKEILSKYGKIKESWMKKNTIFFLLSYQEKLQNVKVEISIRDFGNNYEVINYFGLPVLVMDKGNMFAHKLVALSERKKVANRDLFDIHFFLETNWPINEEIIKVRTKKSLKEYLKYLLGFIKKNVSEKNILFGLGEILDKRQKSFLKVNLKKETLFLLNIYLKNLK
jgi:predicted nucleotidyltransferase component of viral defense system